MIEVNMLPKPTKPQSTLDKVLSVVGVKRGEKSKSAAEIKATIAAHAAKRESRTAYGEAEELVSLDERSLRERIIEARGLLADDKNAEDVATTKLRDLERQFTESIPDDLKLLVDEERSRLEERLRTREEERARLESRPSDWPGLIYYPSDPLRFVNQKLSTDENDLENLNYLDSKDPAEVEHLEQEIERTKSLKERLESLKTKEQFRLEGLLAKYNKRIQEGRNYLGQAEEILIEKEAIEKGILPLNIQTDMIRLAEDLKYRISSDYYSSYLEENSRKLKLLQTDPVKYFTEELEALDPIISEARETVGTIESILRGLKAIEPTLKDIKTIEELPEEVRKLLNRYFLFSLPDRNLIEYFREQALYAKGRIPTKKQSKDSRTLEVLKALKPEELEKLKELIIERGGIVNIPPPPPEFDAPEDLPPPQREGGDIIIRVNESNEIGGENKAGIGDIIRNDSRGFRYGVVEIPNEQNVYKYRVSAMTGNDIGEVIELTQSDVDELIREGAEIERAQTDSIEGWTDENEQELRAENEKIETAKAEIERLNELLKGLLQSEKDPAAEVTYEGAIGHVRTVEAKYGIPISDPTAYFTGKIQEIEARLERERALDPNGEEMARVRNGMSTENYFEWLEGILAAQRAYLGALNQ